MITIKIPQKNKKEDKTNVEIEVEERDQLNKEILWELYKEAINEEENQNTKE